MVIQLVVALIVGFYILSDLDRLRARAYFLVPQKHRNFAGHLAADIGGVFSDYFRGLLIVCGMYGLATILLLYGLSLWHKEIGGYALLVGASAGVLYAVPYIGALTIALVTFLVAFAAGKLAFALWAVGLTLALNQIFDNIVTPKVVGGGVGLHPVMALFALAIGGEMFQLWGLLLSVPVAASVQVILYRLIPKLCEPTPREFLLAEGADPDREGEGPKTGGGRADRPADDISPAANLKG
jgi:predicted PurR-regulated permease PerM